MPEETDLERPGAKTLLAKEVLADIDKAAIALYNDGPRRHLGASIIGDPCSRKLWYGFRWADYKVHNGMQYRLFNRGHKEEERFIEWLTKAGYQIAALNPDTGKQWQVSSCLGHFGGSMDGKAILPIKYNYTRPMLLEFKTNNTGAGFSKLITDKCQVAKPLHYDQQSVYGYLDNIEYSIYLNVCKNDDNIHSEIIKLNHKRGKELEEKAEFIIFTKEPPRKISESPAFYICKFCDFLDVCHQDKPLMRNCRSCKSATAVENKQWKCERFNDIIPPDFIPKGCGDWQSIT